MIPRDPPVTTPDRAAVRIHGRTRSGTPLLSLGIGAAVALLLALLLLGFAPRAAELLVVHDPPFPAGVADAIVPLAGDIERASYAARLWRDGVAPQVAFAELPVDTNDYRARYVRQVRWILERRGRVPAAAVAAIPNDGTTTTREAETLLAYARAQGWDALVVVTSAWHTRRAQWALHGVFAGSGVAVQVVPVPMSAARLRGWWLDTQLRRVVLSEYGKLLLHAVGVR